MWKKQVEKLQEFRQRSKKIRIVEACGKKFNIYKTWKRDQLICVILLHNKTKFQQKNFVCYKHNHILEYLNTIAIEVVKRYCPNDISRNIKDVKWAANKKTLKDAEKLYLDLKKIPNASTV